MKTSLVHKCKPDAKKKGTPTDEPTRKPVRAKELGRVYPSQTFLPAGQLTKREIETTTLLLLICSEDMVEAVPEKYDA